MLGTGDVPDGSWEARAFYAAADPPLLGALYLYIDYWNRHGTKTSGGGCGGIGLANDDRPVVISMSRRGPRTSFCYVGQAVHRATRVELTLTDGTTLDALLLDGELPVQLWIAFTDGTAIPTIIRAFEADTELEALSIAEEWPEPRGNTCWGPFDE